MARFLHKSRGARHLVTSCNLQINTCLFAVFLHTGGCLFAGFKFATAIQNSYSCEVEKKNSSVKIEINRRKKEINGKNSN